MARINNTWYGEFYAPVDSDNVEARQQFYAYAEEAIAAMRHQDSSIPMIIVGDFNGHIKDHYSMETNSNGELILNTVRNQSLELINMNAPTWEGPGRRPTCVDYVACNRKGYEKILKASVRDEIYTSSDHHLIEINMNASLLLMVEPPKLRQTRIPVRKLKQTKRQELYQKLLQEHWKKLEGIEFNDPERCYCAYRSAIIQAAETACSTKETPN